MAKNMLKNQSRPTKPCRCGREDVYTDGRPGVPRLPTGELVGEQCYVDYLINRSIEKRD